jgi:hypothetical protein
MHRELLGKYAAYGGANPAQETNKVQTLYSFPV